MTVSSEVMSDALVHAVPVQQPVEAGRRGDGPCGNYNIYIYIYIHICPTILHVQPYYMVTRNNSRPRPDQQPDSEHMKSRYLEGPRDPGFSRVAPYGPGRTSPSPQPKPLAPRTYVID
jgi:hypothetical protein